MTLSTDCLFVIGHTHTSTGKPCQDYALADAKDSYAYAILCDGCSSGGDTDVGARVIARATCTFITLNHSIHGEFPAPEQVAVHREFVLPQIKKALSLKTDDLLATCLYAVVDENGGYVHALGDGIVAIKKQNGSTILFQFEWAENVPYYPAYGSASAFIARHGGDLEALRLKRKRWDIDPEGKTALSETTDYSLREGIVGITTHFTANELAEIELIALFSDGPEQFGNAMGYADWKDVVRELLAFKQLNGQFVVRRMRTMLRDHAKAGRQPMDDLSMAVIHVARYASEEISPSNPA